MSTVNKEYFNPFIDYNSNVMSDESILDFWSSPFAFLHNIEHLESELDTDKMPFVIMGGRGTGKTMLLRHISYKVQHIKYLRSTPDISFIDYIKRNVGIGVYIRIDGPAIRSFCGSSFSEHEWTTLFIHYFELVIAKAYLSIIKDMQVNREINLNELNKRFVPEMKLLLGYQKGNSLNSVINHIDNEIRIVDLIRSRLTLSNNTEVINRLFLAKALSFKIPLIANAVFSNFENSVRFVLLVDEYENFLKSQQIAINNMIKFAENLTTFRIGMRLEGFHSYETIGDHLKENHDYKQIVLEDFIINKDRTGYLKFLKDIANKRLKCVPALRERNLIDIENLLGKKEDLEFEAKQITSKRRKKHFEILGDNLSQEDIDKISNINPLLEVLNLVWIKRGRKVAEVAKAMSDYELHVKTNDADKYRLDYVNKYKMQLVFLLASIHSKKKMYYSFNTFSYLSSGIIRNFIELCRQCFEIVEFTDLDLFLKEGRISPELQDKAAKQVSLSELDNVRKISNHGTKLYQFIVNIGNIFKDFHTDKSMRYPETNQFTLPLLPLESEEARYYKDRNKIFGHTKKEIPTNGKTGKSKARLVYYL